ncbi:MAG: hypothetical protein KAH95_10145 [Spirochaetales bacterium]|nr:hypothetical protein [Spirochaetales bacterium]
MKKHVPEIYLEQLYLKELSPQKAGSIDTAETVNQLKGIELSNKEIIEQYPPSFIKEGIIRKLNNTTEKQVKKQDFRFYMLRAVPIAAALVILTLNLSQLYKTQTPNEIIRSKGLTPELSIYIDKNNSPFELFNNDFVSTSDLIQMTYNAAGNKYGVIFSIDGRGVITLHYPEDKNSTPIIDPNGIHALPFSYELDDAPEFERFFFVSSKQEFDISTILKSAENILNYSNPETIEKLNLSVEFDQKTIILKKGNLNE